MGMSNVLAVLTYLVSFTFLKTDKGNDLLVTEENHHYRKEREKDTKFGRRKYWVCSYADKYGCKARLTTTMDNEFVNWGLKNNSHNHAVSIIKTEGIKLRNQIKEDTKKGKTRKPMEIISDNYDKAGASNGVKKVLDEKNLARAINRYKNEGDNKNPTTMTGWKIEDQDYLYYNDAGTKKLFLLHDTGIVDPERIMIFGLEKSLEWLIQIVKWAIDGTFKSAPHLWFQLVTIHVILSQNRSIPALYCLLPNKSGATYERLYKILTELAELKPELILCDFELAQANAAAAIFGCAIAYCYFHLSQNCVKLC